MDINLVNYMQNQLQSVPTDFQRYMYDKIDWQERMFGLVGPRGVGKTVLYQAASKRGAPILRFRRQHLLLHAHAYRTSGSVFQRGRQALVYRRGAQVCELVEGVETDIRYTPRHEGGVYRFLRA